jgi:hypothetical protein
MDTHTHTHICTYKHIRLRVLYKLPSPARPWVRILLDAWMSVCACTVLCVGRSLAMGSSLLQGALQTLCRIRKLEKRPRPNRRAVECHTTTTTTTTTTTIVIINNNKDQTVKDILCGLLVEFLATDPEIRVRFPVLPDLLRSSGYGTRSTEPREYNWGATSKKR